MVERGQRARVLLQDMVEDISFDRLPLNWSSFDLKKFSKEKTLWDFQQEALKNALKVLWKYYEDFVDYRPNESLETNLDRKKKLFQWYRDNGLAEDLDISLGKTSGEISRLLENYYPVEAGKISYKQLINRMCFWMATGAGKTLVLIKLIQVLWQLVRRGEIPPNDVLVLTCRDDLIDQLKRFVEEFNSANDDLKIKLRELKEYPDAKREHPSSYREREITVFYYRSDLLSNEQKEKIVDFRNYDNDGRWYILLDEAHKGDREESKRQHIYSILSRNGFLFNFSATFADERDYITTVFNFNLSEFTKAGYGKHILILKQELRPFKEKEDYSGTEKQKAVLKSLILLAYVKKFSEMMAHISSRMNLKLYHKPLLLVLAHTVETESADLKLFFRELEQIGMGKVTDTTWRQAKEELWNELKEQPFFMFEEEGRFEIDHRTFQDLSKEDLLRLVYNSSSWGEIEVLVRPSNRKELAFKLKTSDRPFALVKIGDISGWLKSELVGYEINEQFEDESYFEALNRDDSEINILMGSHGFYEGWDSNRPNVINFINIGTGVDAKKFILQCVGRGVRIQPLKSKRKRLLPLFNAGEVSKRLFSEIKDIVLPLETLFIIGTNRDALYEVIKYLDQERREKGQRLSLFVSDEARKHNLLIPTYTLARYLPTKQRPLARFEIRQEELNLLRRYIEFIHDDRVLLALYDTEPEIIEILKESLKNPDMFYRFGEKSFKDVDTLARQVLRYFGIPHQKFKELKELGDEIRHFKNIQVMLKNITELQRKIDSVRQYRDPHLVEAELRKKLESKEITLDEYTEEVKKLAKITKEETMEWEGKLLRIKHVIHHYYVPLILADDEKIRFIKHIIKTPSEVRFINNLEKYLENNTNRFKEFDWWMFSKLDESLDDVYIPYYDPRVNAILHYKPDFIFWLQRGSDYFIVFVDPKSTVYTDYEHKVEGYKEVFEEGEGAKIISHGGLNVRVFLFLYTEDRDRIAEGYRKYWFDSIDKVLERLLKTA